MSVRSSARPPTSIPVGALPDRRERRRIETREGLSRAALRLFAEKGFGETTVEDITNAADVGKGTFFNYFPSKQHILVAFGEMQIGRLREFVASVKQTDEPMPQILKKLIDRMTEEPERNPETVRLVLLANLTGEPVRSTMREKQAEARRLLKELMEMGQRRGEIRTDHSAEEIARAFFQMVFGTLMMWSLHADVTLKERMGSALGLLAKGIQASGPAGEEQAK